MKLVFFLVLVIFSQVVSAADAPVLQLTLSDVGKDFVVTITDHRVSATEGVAVDPDAVITLTSDTFKAIYDADDKALAAYSMFRAGQIGVEVKKPYQSLFMKGYLRVYNQFKKQHTALSLP